MEECCILLLVLRLPYGIVQGECSSRRHDRPWMARLHMDFFVDDPRTKGFLNVYNGYV